LTRTFQKHEAAVRAAEAAVAEESMLSKEALSKAQADFEKCEMKVFLVLLRTHSLLHALVCCHERSLWCTSPDTLTFIPTLTFATFTNHVLQLTKSKLSKNCR
jgi:hypothetical protein